MHGGVLSEGLTDEPRRPLNELLFLALPTVAQMASYTVMQFADTLQLALGAGDVAATAAGMAGFMVFAVQAWAFGAIMCVNTLVSQSVGAGQPDRGGQYMWQGIWFGLLAGLVLIPSSLIADDVLRRLGHGPELVAAAKTYYDIEVLALPVRLAGMAVGQFLLAVGRPRITLLAAVCAVLLDVALNFLFITGRFGLPRMGIVGAAWATNAAVCCETFIVCLFAFGPAMRNAYRSHRARLHWPSLKQLIIIGVPAGFQVVSEVAAWLLFCVWIMNQFGQAAVTANNYMMQYMKVSFMPAFGLSAAVTALVGRYIGAGRLDLARQRAHLGFKVAFAYMIGCGTLFFLGRHVLIGLFSADPDVIRIGAQLLLFAAVYQLFDALYIIYIGALRGAGDTNVPAWVTAGLCWVLVVGGGAAVSRRFPEIGPIGPWIAAGCYGIAIGTFLFVRFTRGQWKSIVPPKESSGYPAPETALVNVGAT
jgi:MATE family multidrug resistance protein